MKALLKILLSIPLINRKWKLIYKLLGVEIGKGARISPRMSLWGSYSYLHCGKYSEINPECFLLAREHIYIGENSTLAYRVMILTSANPNTPYNKLANVYPSVQKAVHIMDNVWVGAGAIILPGVTIGSCSVVAAGAVVNRDVEPYTVVAGCPAKVVKTLDNLRNV